ncbi:endothelin-converting enzyme 2-like [Haemaphysalis longicornis]
MLLRGYRVINVARKPLAMYEYCMGDLWNYGSNATRFFGILSELGLAWPDSKQNRPNVSAFYALLTLQLKWNVPLLLELRVRRLNYTPRWRFTVSPGSLIPIELNHQRSVAASDRYKYWRSFYGILPEHASQPEINDSDIDAIIDTEAVILRSLYGAMARQDTQPVLVTVAQIGKYTPSVTSNEWLNALRQINFDPDVSSGDQVLLTDEDFSHRLGDVLQKYKNEQLLMFIAWSFVQLYAATADDRLLTARYGNEARLKLYRPYFCERFVESAYGLLVIATHSVSRFRPEERAFVNAGFDSLVRTAASKVNGAIWLDVQSRRAAQRKVRSALLHLWPSDRYLNNSELERVYEAFPSGASSFFEHWVNSSASIAAVFWSQQDGDVFHYPVNYALPYLLYDRPTGTVNVAVGAVNHPLYYGDGTSAMFYGGLGFSMALQLVKSLDQYGLQWHPNGTFGGSLLTSSSMEAYRVRDSCLDSSQDHSRGGNSSLFPEIPALEVAYAAYLDAVQKSGGAPQGVAPGLSGEQVFFATLCYMTCSSTASDQQSRLADCNKAVRNFPAFADAYQCPTGSAMNPKKKCSFFD